MAQQSNAGSFYAYLEASQRTAANPPVNGATMALLNMLDAADQKQKGVTDLMVASGMSFTNFADALKSLQDSGYVTVNGEGALQIAKLTALGQEVARPSRR